MRQRRSIVMLGAAVAVVAGGYVLWPVKSADAQQQVATNSRWVMLNAEYTVTSDVNGGRQVIGLFRLDTATGESWRYTEHVRRDGDVRPRWISTKERTD